MSITIAYLKRQGVGLSDTEQLVHKLKAHSPSHVKIGINEEKQVVYDSTIEEQVTCVVEMNYSGQTKQWHSIVRYTGYGELIVNDCKIMRKGYAQMIFSGTIIKVNNFNFLFFVGGMNNTKKEVETAISDHYTISTTSDILGKGISSMVYYAYVKKHPDYRLACKETVLKDSYSYKVVGGVTKKELFEREINILKGLSHPNVTMLIHSDEIRNKDDSSISSRIFTPLALYGTLKDYINVNRVAKDNSARLIFYQLMLGLRYIHDKGYIHKDIKPENILIDYKKGIPRAIITDFGLALRKDEVRSRTARLGTTLFNPPEALGRNQVYDEKVDCWAAGIVLFEMLTGGDHPFNSPNDSVDGLEERILNEDPCLDYSFIQNENNYGTDLILRLLEKQPKDRASCTDCIKSDWILQDQSINSIRVSYSKIFNIFCEEKNIWFNQIKPQQPQVKIHQQQNIPVWWKKLKKSDYVVDGIRRPFLSKGVYAYCYKVTKWTSSKKGYTTGTLRQYLDGLVVCN